MAEYQLELYAYSKLYKSKEGGKEDKLIRYEDQDVFLPDDFGDRIIDINYKKSIRTAYNLNNNNYKKLGEGGFNCVYINKNNTIFRLLKNDNFLGFINGNNNRQSEWVKEVKTKRSIETDPIKKNLGFFGFNKEYWYIKEMNSEFLGLHIQRILCSNNDIRSVYICDIYDYGLYSFKYKQQGERDKFFWRIQAFL